MAAEPRPEAPAAGRRPGKARRACRGPPEAASAAAPAASDPPPIG